MTTMAHETAAERYAGAVTLMSAGADRTMLAEEAQLMVPGFRIMALRAGVSQEAETFKRDMDEWLDYLALLLEVSS